MSVAGYLSEDRPKKRRQKGDEAKEKAERLRRPDGEKLPGGLVRAGDEGRFYEDVEEYDPVLRSHCRL